MYCSSLQNANACHTKHKQDNIHVPLFPLKPNRLLGDRLLGDGILNKRSTIGMYQVSNFMFIGISYNWHLPGSVVVPLIEVELEPLAANCGVSHARLLTADGRGLSTSLVIHTSPSGIKGNVSKQGIV